MEFVVFVSVIFVQIFLYAVKCSSIHIDSIPICKPHDQQSSSEVPEVHLTAHGISSSVYVLLRDSESDSTSLVGAGIEGRLQWPPRGRMAVYPPPANNQPACRLKITAPPGHVVYVEVLETRLEIHRALIVHHEEREVKCPLNIFLPDTKSKPVYTANMCDMEPVIDVPLLPSELELAWKPPLRFDSSDFEVLTKDRMLLLTAVGKEATCRLPTGAEDRNKYHTCMKIGWEPILCVSKDLMCNGQKNCPKGSTSSDEAESICRAPQSLEDIARKFIQEFQLPLGFNEKWVESAKKQSDPTTTTTETSVAHKIVSIWKKIEASTRRPAHANPDDSKMSAAGSDPDSLTISTMLNQYGPWGYLMLGMIFCGGVILLCGLWECCCRRPKPFPAHGRGDGNGHRSTTTANGGATVLVMNRGEDGGGVGAGRPPEYEDLDQPPLYAALFPNNKQGVAVIQMEDRRASREEQMNALPREDGGPKDEETGGGEAGTASSAASDASAPQDS